MSKRTLETEKKPDVVKTFLPISLMQDWIISEGSKTIQAFLDMQICKKKSHSQMDQHYSFKEVWISQKFYRISTVGDLDQDLSLGCVGRCGKRK